MTFPGLAPLLALVAATALAAEINAGGATVRVIRPPHVVVPEGTTVALRREGKAIGEPQAADAAEVIEFHAVAPGVYDVLLAGPKPLQRKRFPIDVPPFGIADVVLSLDAYRLMGEVEYDKKPFAATVVLQGDLSSAELEADETGTFSAELWQAEDFAVSVEADVLATPYLVMKSASPSDAEWRLRIPSRRITGRVFDAETGRPIPKASLQIESDVEGTRATRPIPLDGEGRFDLAGAGEGQYSLVARAEGYLAGEPVELTVREHDEDRQLDISLRRGTQVVVSVVDTQGRPLPRALVLSGLGPAATTDANGQVTVTLADADQAVFILPREGSMAIAHVSPRHVDSGLRVTVPPGQATLRIEARSTEGTPLRDVGFALRHGGIELPFGVLSNLARLHNTPLSTDASGNAALASLPAGTYELAWKAPGAASVLSESWMRLELVPGETVVAQTFRRSPVDRSPE